MREKEVAMTFPIKTTVEHIPIGNVIDFGKVIPGSDEHLVGERILLEDYERLTHYQDPLVEEGGVPFRNLANGYLFLVPGTNDAWLDPDVPQVFTEAFDE